ncbi:hypothetical protein Cgig2_007666 [Carnegiea gigantea]|uniref:Uncharacterized protein n=1 Tax=Carnegiea gigantea TaxID=171969 RepID=A0A9Q1K415_9CARY|nr:hypothetical protein Cgig2_007666 [Carnegiea gigantea]
MASFSGLLSHCSVLHHYNGNPMLPFCHRTSTGDNTELVSCKFVPKWIPRSRTQALCVERVHPSFAMSSGGYDGLRFDDEHQEEPFWLQLFKDTVRSLKSLLAFLAEQPGQLKYIEWPGFQHTLRTATLTLVLVAMLIVALSAVDSALAFVLAFILRKPA